MSISLVRVDLTPSLHVMSLHRQHGSHPLFVLREFDVKVLRHTAHRKKHEGQEGQQEDEKNSSSSPPRRHRVVCGESQFMATGPSEQALRVSIRAAVLRLGLTMEAATAHEIKLLKEADVLGKRAPSASLLTGPDMCHLLRAFGVHSIATKLSRALETLEPGVMIPCHEDTDVGSHKMRLKNDSHEDDNVVKKLRLKKEKEIRVKLEHSSPNQSKRKLIIQESKHTSPTISSSPAKRPRSLSHGEIIRSAEHDDISIKDEQAAGCHVFQCPSSSEQFGTSPATTHGTLHSQPTLEHSTLNTSTYIPPTFPQFSSSYTPSSHTHPIPTDSFPTTHGHPMEQTRYQTSTTNITHLNNNNTLPLTLAHPHSTLSSTPHSHTYEHHSHHISTSSPQHSNHHHHVYGGSSQSYPSFQPQQSTSFTTQPRQTHGYESIPTSQFYQQSTNHTHHNTTITPTTRPSHASSTLTPTKHYMGFPSHPSTSQLIPSSHSISTTPNTITTTPSSHSNPSTHPTPASNIPPSSHPHNPPPPITTRIQPITIPSHITSRPHIMDSLLPLPSPILLSSPNPSKFSLSHLSPNPAKPIHPSISTQHLSSLRAFSAHPFHKRDTNMCIDMSSDLGDLQFPPLCDTQELRIRADISSLLPIPTPTAETCFSDESSPDMDTEPVMESLDQINIEHELDTTYHPMVEKDGSSSGWNRKHMNIPRQTSGNCQTESWHTLKHSHHGLNQVIAT